MGIHKVDPEKEGGSVATHPVERRSGAAVGSRVLPAGLLGQPSPTNGALGVVCVQLGIETGGAGGERSEATRQLVADLDNPPVVVAVDCPSGIDCDSGEAAPQAIPADLTVTMAAFKQGLLKFPAYQLAGEIQLVGIGLPEDGEGLAAWRRVKSRVVDSDWVQQALPERPLDAHKGTFGTALVTAGSTNYTGAAWLAGMSPRNYVNRMQKET